MTIDEFLDEWARVNGISGDREGRARRYAKRQQILRVARHRINSGLDTSVYQSQQSVLRRLRVQELGPAIRIEEPLVILATPPSPLNNEAEAVPQTRATTPQNRGLAIVPAGQSAALARQNADLVGLASERVHYSVQASTNAREISQQLRSGNISPEVAEVRAVAARRQLESTTRANLPGPEPAGTLNAAAARRNEARYGDPLGYRDPAHLRELAQLREVERLQEVARLRELGRHRAAARLRPRTPPTTSQIIRSSGNPNVRVTAYAVAGGTLGLLGLLLGAMQAATELNGLFQVELEGLSPEDFDLGHEFHGVPIGDGWVGTIQVRENIIGNKKFFILLRTAYREDEIASADPDSPQFRSV